MQSVCLEALLIPIVDGVSLRLADEAQPDAGEFTVELPHDIRSVPSLRRVDASRPSDRPPFLFDPSAPERGLYEFRIFELRDYLWELDFSGSTLEATVTSSLQESVDKDLWRARANHGRFQFVNFLGAAWIEVTVAGYPPRRVFFEVASPKLDYEQEYRSMVESIGAGCQQLLLEWGTPTTLNFSPDPAKRAQTLLEQFLFLRHMLGPDRLELYLETIQRQPHSRLASERDWKPAGAANPSLFLRDPLRHGRDWHWSGSRIVADGLREERRYDTHDTPPNRFLKFALKDFSNLCGEILNARQWTAESPVVREAEAMQQSLEAFLTRPFFSDIGEIQRIPFESTTLQRREGYREILQAWLMLDAAAQIDWPGRGEAYKGNSRNVATLYEYWLYFLLVRAFQDNLGMEPQKDPLESKDGALPFCCRADDGRLLIHLKQREPSFCRFRWVQGDHELAVHFFYNRSFNKRDIGIRGTYSKTFRPDYTLVIIPEEFAGEDWHASERAAEAAGRIAYLHFDAKYRGENLQGILGDEDDPSGALEYGRSKATGSSKDEDLYKMHTYNEAIRRTVGSYVLYPGSAGNPVDANARFQRYHEIIPGVGAFALRPERDNRAPSGLPVLLDFIRDILYHHLTRFTQSYRIDYWTESTIREDPSDYVSGPVSLKAGIRPPKDTQLLLGFVRGDSAAQECRETLTFFCHGVEWDSCIPRQPGEPTDLRFDPFRSDFFVAYHRGKSTAWIAKVCDVRLVSAQERAEELKRPLSEMHAAYYYRFQLEEPQDADPRDISSLVVRRPGKPAACRLSEFVRCPKVTAPAAA